MNAKSLTSFAQRARMNARRNAQTLVRALAGRVTDVADPDADTAQLLVLLQHIQVDVVAMRTVLQIAAHSKERGGR